MLRMRALGGLCVALGLSACMNVDTMRNVPVDVAPPTADPVVVSPDWRVLDVRVNVPRDLLVSEANDYLPAADIVWTEDPKGDRHEQVRAILDEAITMGTSHLRGTHDVYIDVELRQFHALSEKARATVGGNHDIAFDYVVRDAQTGADIVGPERVVTRLKAFGGVSALAAVRRGETQKWRITQHLAGLMSNMTVGPEFPMKRRDKVAAAPSVKRF